MRVEASVCTYSIYMKQKVRAISDMKISFSLSSESDKICTLARSGFWTLFLEAAIPSTLNLHLMQKGLRYLVYMNGLIHSEANVQ